MIFIPLENKRFRYWNETKSKSWPDSEPLAQLRQRVLCTNFVRFCHRYKHALNAPLTEAWAEHRRSTQNLSCRRAALFSLSSDVATGAGQLQLLQRVPFAGFLGKVKVTEPDVDRSKKVVLSQHVMVPHGHLQGLVHNLALLKAILKLIGEKKAL